MKALSKGILVVIIVLMIGRCSISQGQDPDGKTLQASFTNSPASPTLGQAVQFTDTSTGNPSSWAWDFGDGSTSTIQNPSHTYTAAGSKTVTLNVSNASGSDSVSWVVTVVTARLVSFTFSPPLPAIGELAQFTDTSVGSPTSWLWDFGDGTTSNAQNPNHAYTTAGCYTVTLTITNNSGSNSTKLPLNVKSPSAIFIDHHNTKLASIPEEWITAAKQTLHIAYGFTSHGSQLTTGMTGLVGWKGDLYAWIKGGANGALDLKDFPGDFGSPDVTTVAHDLGQPNRTAWEAATREYLAVHPEVNVVIWAWCWHMTTDDASLIQLYYLDLMNGLEQDYPNVKFVYMTGKTTGGDWGDGTTWVHMNYMRAKQIREYCLRNNKILYDFNDIESWDPDGNWYGDKRVVDSCNYDSNGDGAPDRNWAIEWQNAHPGEWYNCEAAHTQPLNANLKAYAAWWLWARLAGWDGR